jgi:hypothetical protein
VEPEVAVAGALRGARPQPVEAGQRQPLVRIAERQAGQSELGEQRGRVDPVAAQGREQRRDRLDPDLRDQRGHLTHSQLDTRHGRGASRSVARAASELAAAAIVA